MRTQSITYREAISQATVQCMDADDRIFIGGGGVDDIKGVFGTTLEAFRQFGGTRVFDVPNSENALAGICVGAAATGMRPLWVHPRNDFMLLAADQIINLAAKWKYMLASERGLPIVIRGIIGRGWGQGATHSQSLQSVFAHFPGLRVAMPATPADAKGLLVDALRSDTPSILLEHRGLFEVQGDTPVDPIPTPWGLGVVRRSGEDITVVATSVMVVEALRAADFLAGHGISLEVIDPRSIRPLDTEIIVDSVRKTGRLIVADTSWSMCGFSAEVAAIAAEHCHDKLKAPVLRLTQKDCPAPVSKPLEDAFHPSFRSLIDASLGLLPNDLSVEIDFPETPPAFMGPY